MDTCVICGKLAEGITLEIEDEDGEILEKYVCNSCSEVIGEIAYQTIAPSLKSLVEDVQTLMDFMDDFNEKDSDNTRQFRHRIYVRKKAVSKLDEHSSQKNEPEEEELEDEEVVENAFSNNEKEINSLSNDVLADQLLSFAKENGLADDTDDLLSYDLVELFWKSKGIRYTHGASAESKIKMKKVEKMARDKIVAGIFSASNEELARELADFAKKMEGKENGQGVYVHMAEHRFWRDKGLDYRAETAQIEIRKGQIERLAQELIDKDFHEWREQQLQTESELLPQLTKACVEWAITSGRNSVTIKDVKYFRQEKKIQLLEATERALYLSTNNELKALKRNR
jgi:hypothetical protein